MRGWEGGVKILVTSTDGGVNRTDPILDQRSLAK